MRITIYDLLTRAYPNRLHAPLSAWLFVLARGVRIYVQTACCDCSILGKADYYTVENSPFLDQISFVWRLLASQGIHCTAHQTQKSYLTVYCSMNMPT